MPAVMALARGAAAAALWAPTAEAAGVRLRITNGCSLAPIWIVHEAGPRPGPDLQNIRIDPGQSHNFRTDDGLSSTRYWPKMGCDDMGNNCGLGGSGGPQEKCVGTGDYKACAPPVDTKFEASFGHSAEPCDPVTNSMKGCDYVDVSLVDGWTLPFKLALNGQCEGKGGKGPQVIDCSGLTFDSCPAMELLNTIGQSVDLKVTNPHLNKVVGCYSPCTKLIDTKYNNNIAIGRKAQDPAVAPYCCPTPPESPEACRQGPVKDTAYVQTMHRLCPGVYGYSYDDGTGLLRCSSATTYDLTFFCPTELPVKQRAKLPIEAPASFLNLMYALLGVIALAVVLLLIMQSNWFLSRGSGGYQHGTMFQQQGLPMVQQQGLPMVQAGMSPQQQVPVGGRPYRGRL